MGPNGLEVWRPKREPCIFPITVALSDIAKSPEQLRRRLWKS
jgi:hypothetical protein